MTVRRGAPVALLALALVTPAAADGGGAGSPLLPLTALDAEARAPASDVRIAPSTRGVLGAWLVAGPYPAGRGFAVAGVDPAILAPSLGASASGVPWQLASSGEGPIDLVKTLSVRGRQDLVAYAGAVVHVARGGRHHLLLGVDDGVRVRVDGAVVYTRDEARPVREDDDVVALDLSPGDHSLVLELRQRDGAWAFRARLVDETLAPSPGLYARLPGTSADDARALAAKMSWISVERALDTSAEPPRYAPRLVVRFPEGAPRGVPLAVRARIDRAFDVAAGDVAVNAHGVSELVVALPFTASADASRTVHVDVAGRVALPTLPSRPRSEAAIARAVRALAKTPEDAPFLREGSRSSVLHLAERLAELVSRGDADEVAQLDEARELDALAAALERGADPYVGRTGAMRRALRSPLDGKLTEVGVYLPPSYDPFGKPLPLVVALHGMNGFPMAMIRWLFGGDDPKRDQAWEERHVGALPAVPAIVVAPSGRGNTMYRDVGEADVVYAVDWARRTFAVDPARVTMTGPSMGGIGAGANPLRRPNVYAAAAPLCGYHSLFVRRDVAGRPMRPWERFLAEERSAAFWAENGEGLPLYIVHGTRDLPEENSGVLIERYEKLGFPVRHEHPDLGHNVWQPTYENLAGLSWLLGKKATLSPVHVRFRTARTRWGKSAWVSVEELANDAAWGEIDARVRSRSKITASTSNLAALAFERDAQVLDPDGDIQVDIDGKTLAFGAGERLAMHVPEGGGARAWSKGPPAREKVVKHGAVTGPLRDVHFEPSLVVHTSGGDEGRAAEEIARVLARVRPGLTVAYPVVSDVDFLARGEALAHEKALVLVGRRNRVLAELQKIEPFPIQVEDGAVTIGAERITGREVGAAFVRPNPARKDRYVVVVAGADVPGLLRATSLPDLLPDFVVWDAGLGPSRGQILLGAGALRAGGFFRKDWSLPDDVRDPLATATRPGAKNERDATPYLP